jgi:hypothetical protein
MEGGIDGGLVLAQDTILLHDLLDTIKISSNISGSQAFVEWADLELNLQCGRHVSSHKHSMKGINTTPPFKSPT